MKLNAAQVKQTLNKMDAQVLPDNHPAVSQLVELYGDHTYFLDRDGLKFWKRRNQKVTQSSALLTGPIQLVALS